MNFDTVIDRKGTYCTQWDYVKDRFGKDGLLPFTISDMDFQAPKEIIEALIKRVNHGVFGYSRWNHEDFKNSIEFWYKSRFNYQIDKEWILYAPSVIYSVAKFIEMKSEKGDGVLIFTPAYDGFFKVIGDNDRKIISSPLIKNGNNYKIDFEDFEKKCKEAKIFLMCSPHNPVGKVWSKEELEKIISICKKYNIFIISDEIHMDIVYKGKHTPILEVAGDYIESIAICTAASKTFNIPALGGAYILCTTNLDRDEYLRILKNKEALSSPSILGVIATIVAYNQCGYWVDGLLKYTKENIEYVREYLKENIPELTCDIPGGCYFAWIDFSKLNISSESFQKALIDIGKVAIMPGVTYGEEGKNYLRLNIGCPREKVKDGLSRLKLAVESFKK